MNHINLLIEIDCVLGVIWLISGYGLKVYSKYLKSNKKIIYEKSSMEYYKNILQKIFYIKNPEIVPVRKEELYLFLSFYNVNEQDHGVMIEKCLEDYGIQIRDKSGRLPRYTINGKQVRCYPLWKIHYYWKPPSLTDVDDVLKLKYKINNRCL